MLMLSFHLLKAQNFHSSMEATQMKLMYVSLILVHSILVHHAFVDIYFLCSFCWHRHPGSKKCQFHGTIYLNIKFVPNPFCLWNNHKLQLVEIFVNCWEEYVTRNQSQKNLSIKGYKKWLIERGKKA